MMLRLTKTVGVAVWLACAAASTFAQDGPAVRYAVTIPEPEHHWLQVEVTFPGLGSEPLTARMSRSSPGRYAVHEFAKNVFMVEAYDSGGRRLATTRPGADEWQVAGHDGTVRLVYRIFGDHADGTYMAVDTTHAHLNMPATFMWARALEDRPVEISFAPPTGSNWTVGTQLVPTPDPFRFTAPNLQYFLDSPVEFAALVESRFTMRDPRGESGAFRVLAHSDGAQADVDALAVMVERLVREHTAVYGVLPPFEPGHYTFLLDYVAWVEADAMEHRNSTYITQPGLSLRDPDARRAALRAISHEFAHVWNVERIRPEGLEPFDFTRANVTCCLWLGEGFTEYYGSLLLVRAGLSTTMPLGSIVSVINGAGRSVRSAVAMSEHAPFADAAVANDVDDRDRTFISYYTWGEAIALGLDLSIREQTDGRLSLDDYMRRLWVAYGAVPAPRPGYVARPYTLADLRRELAALLGDREFADIFFDRYVEGHEVMDYARLLNLAGFVLRPIAPDRGWIGDVQVREERGGLLVGGRRHEESTSLVPFNSPAYDAGIDAGDVIVSIDDRPATRARWDAIASGAPGDRILLVVQRRDGTRVTTSATLAPDPSLQIVAGESLGPVTEQQRAFREAWLGSRVR